jgi:hypothetical protein
MSGASPAYRGFFFMADMDVPDKFSVAIRIILWVVFCFIFALVGWEQFWEGRYVAAGVNGGLLVITTVIAVKWRQLAKFIGAYKVTMLYIGLAVLCAFLSSQHFHFQNCQKSQKTS